MIRTTLNKIWIDHTYNIDLYGNIPIITMILEYSEVILLEPLRWQ